MFVTGTYHGSSYIGIFCRANDRFIVMPRDADAAFVDKARDTLKAEVIYTNAMGSTLVGSLIAMNSNGVIGSNYLFEDEISVLKKYMNVTIIKEKLNAIGNNLLVNDKGAVINRDIGSKNIKEISDTLGVEVVKLSIATYNTVGMAAVATNKGILCHPKVSDEEKNMLKEILKVQVTPTTVNFGVGLVGSSIIANSNGAIVGDRTTPIEMDHIEYGLQDIL